MQSLTICLSDFVVISVAVTVAVSVVMIVGFVVAPVVPVVLPIANGIDLEVVDDHSSDVGTHFSQYIPDPQERLPPSLLGTCDEDYYIRNPRANNGIGYRQHRWSVNDDV